MNKLIWTIIRTIIFIVVGLLNTVFIRVEDIGSWENYLGYFFLLLAAIDTFVIAKNLLKSKKGKVV